MFRGFAGHCFEAGIYLLNAFTRRPFIRAYQIPSDTIIQAFLGMGMEISKSILRMNQVHSFCQGW